MKTRILTITLLAGIAYGQTYLSAVDGNNQVTATTKGYVDAADGALQTQIDALVPSGVVATVTANGVQYGASEGNITVTQQFATVSGDNVSAFALDKVQFDTSATNTLAEGDMGWNADDGTVSIGLPGGNVQLQIGHESLIRTKADSTTVSNGWVAYQVGFSSARPTIDVSNGGHAPLGIATEDINDSNGGYVTLRGFVRDVDTSGYDLNAELYASTNGPAVTNRPAYPNEAFQVGRVASVHATEGIILAQTPTCSKTWTELDEQYKLTSTSEKSISNLTVYGNVILTNTVWDDITLSALQLNSGAAAPEFRVYTNGLTTGAGIKAVNYDSGDSAFGQIQLKHTYKMNTDIEPHIHFSTIDDRSAVTNIQFRLDAFYGRINQLLTNTYSETITVTGTNAFQHTLASFPGFGSGNLGPSAIVHFEITCVEDGGVDNKLFIHDIDFHFESDKLGSDNEVPNGL